MVLDPAHQPFAVRARSWLLVWDTAVPTEEGKGPLGRWALVYGGKPQRRERDPALPADPGFWEPGAVHPGWQEPEAWGWRAWGTEGVPGFPACTMRF